MVQMRGEEPLEWAKVKQSGREGGVWVYIPKEVLDSSLADVGLEGTPADALFVRRYAVRGHGKRARVLLVLKRKEESPIPPGMGGY